MKSIPATQRAAHFPKLFTLTYDAYVIQYTYMQEALRDVIFQYPYNSFGKTYLAAGKEYPERFGGNCVFLTQQLTRRLIEKGLQPKYLWSKDRCHWATLCRTDRNLFYFDPILFHTEPINISQVLKKGERQVCSAFPIIDGHFSQVIINRMGKHDIAVQAYGRKK